MAESAADIKATMDAMADYIDRLYFTMSWHGKTCAMLASGPGMPVWAEITRTVKSVVTTPKCKKLWNGSGNASTPTGWTDVDFDDSAWPGAVGAWAS